MSGGCLTWDKGSGEGLGDLYREGPQGEGTLTPLPCSQVSLEALGQA